MFLYINKKEVTSEFDGEFSVRKSLDGSGSELSITGVSVDVKVRDLIELTAIGGQIFRGVVTQGSRSPKLKKRGGDNNCGRRNIPTSMDKCKQGF